MSPSPVRILFVDDEERILRSLAMQFRRHYEVFTESDPRRALERLKTERIQVLVSDQRMPQMSGAELLAQARVLVETPQVLSGDPADSPHRLFRPRCRRRRAQRRWHLPLPDQALESPGNGLHPAPGGGDRQPPGPAGAARGHAGGAAERAAARRRPGNPGLRRGLLPCRRASPAARAQPGRGAGVAEHRTGGGAGQRPEAGRGAYRAAAEIPGPGPSAPAQPGGYAVPRHPGPARTDQPGADIPLPAQADPQGIVRERPEGGRRAGLAVARAKPAGGRPAGRGAARRPERRPSRRRNRRPWPGGFPPGVRGGRRSSS